MAVYEVETDQGVFEVELDRPIPEGEVGRQMLEALVREQLAAQERPKPVTVGGLAEQALVLRFRNTVMVMLPSLGS